MEPRNPLPDGDLSGLDDLTLVLAAREQGDLRAFAELLLRYLDSALEFVDAQTHAQGVSCSDREDARQDTVLAVWATILCYRQPGAKFRTVLGEVLAHDLRDAERRRKLTLQLFTWLSPADDSAASERPAPAPEAPHADPAQIVEEHEMLVRLQAAIDSLGPKFRELSEHMASGGSLRAYARARHIPYGRVKRGWNQGLRTLRVLMRDFAD